jgi:alpha-D-xyloside xylohydrolase
MISSVCLRRSFISAAVLLLFAGALSAQEGQVVLTRGGSTIVLEPYAPNILRVTLSLKREPAVAAPGYGLIAAPAAAGWSASQTKLADIYKSDRIVASVERPQSPPWDDSTSFFPSSTPAAHITFTTPDGKKLLEMTGWTQAVPNQKDGTAAVLARPPSNRRRVLHRGRELCLAGG